MSYIRGRFISSRINHMFPSFPPIKSWYSILEPETWIERTSNWQSEHSWSRIDADLAPFSCYFFLRIYTLLPVTHLRENQLCWKNTNNLFTRFEGLEKLLHSRKVFFLNTQVITAKRIKAKNKDILKRIHIIRIY